MGPYRIRISTSVERTNLALSLGVRLILFDLRSLPGPFSSMECESGGEVQGYGSAVNPLRVSARNNAAIIIFGEA